MSAHPPAHAPPGYLLRLADDRLVLGHRLSEWCGHAPILEEDIALANVALDLIGQATALLELAAAREGNGRTADALAYFRDAREYRNLQLVELPNGDFAVTIVRQFLFDAWDQLLLDALSRGADAALAGIAAKAAKESRYHLRHSIAGWQLPSLPARVALDLGFPVPDAEDMVLAWRGRPGSLPRVSFSDLYEDFGRSRRTRPRDEFRGKIVLIGVTATGLGDLRVTPLSATQPGAEILGTAIENLKNGRAMRYASPWWPAATRARTTAR